VSVRVAIEGSTRTASCAVASGDAVAERSEVVGAVEGLPALLGRALADAGAALGDVDEIVVGAGPGSYTGTRAAVTFANALSYSLDRPVVSVSALDSLAHAVAEQGSRTLVALEAGRGRFYVAGYDAGLAPLGGLPTDRASEPEELVAYARGLAASVLAAGAGALAQRAALEAIDGVSVREAAHPSAAAHLRLAAERPDLAERHDVAGARVRYAC
jgi:tRNA threonylcarbamoyladenosine biosynthesis protein TsaB